MSGPNVDPSVVPDLLFLALELIALALVGFVVTRGVAAERRPLCTRPRPGRGTGALGPYRELRDALVSWVGGRRCRLDCHSRHRSRAGLASAVGAATVSAYLRDLRRHGLVDLMACAGRPPTPVDCRRRDSPRTGCFHTLGGLSTGPALEPRTTRVLSLWDRHAGWAVDPTDRPGSRFRQRTPGCIYLDQPCTGCRSVHLQARRLGRYRRAEPSLTDGRGVDALWLT